MRARDLAALQMAVYRSAGLLSYDCFPQTPHIEVPALMEGPQVS